MAGTHKFDYVAISGIYQNMNEIIGDTSNPESIAGILHNIDLTYRDNVAVSDMAVYGDLGSQLLLDWDNTSSDFPNFVTNFENWATLIANAAGAYQKFEEDIANTKIENPLGTSSKGRGESYTLNGNYSNFTSDYLNTAAASVRSYIPLSGIGYIDTDMVNYEKNRKTGAIWSFGLNALSTGLGIWGGTNVVKAEIAAGKTLSSSYNTIKNGIRGGNPTPEIVDTPLQQRINNAAGVSNPPASANGAPASAGDSIFSSVPDSELAAYNPSAFGNNTPIQNSIDNMVGLNRASASYTGAPSGIGDSIFASASPSELATYNPTAFSAANTGGSISMLGQAQAPDLSLQALKTNATKAAGALQSGVVKATTTGGVNPRIYGGLTATKIAEGFVSKQQNSSEQSITSVPVSGVMGSNASVSSSIYSNH